MHSSSDSCVWAFGDVFLEGVRLCFCRGDFLFGSCTGGININLGEVPHEQPNGGDRRELASSRMRLWLTPGPRGTGNARAQAEP